jgi:acyl-CoA thioesterase I
MGGARTRTSGGGGSWRSRVSQSPGVTAAVALALILLIWVLWPSPYANVTNLDSRGSAIIAFGDSLTAGYGASAGEDYPTKLSTRTGVTVVNAGVSGDTTESARARLERDVLAHDPRIVIIGLGGNDYLRSVPITVTEENLRAIIRETQDAGAMVVLLGFTFPSLNANYGAMYERVAKEEGCLLIAGTLKGILRDPALKSDAIHPNARGYDLMAERISGPFGKLLRKSR